MAPRLVMLAGSWLLLQPRVHERRIEQVLEWGSQLLMLVSDPARRNGELLTAPISKPTRTSVSCPRTQSPAGSVLHAHVGTASLLLWSFAAASEVE